MAEKDIATAKSIFGDLNKASNDLQADMKPVINQIESHNEKIGEMNEKIKLIEVREEYELMRERMEQGI